MSAPDAPIAVAERLQRRWAEGEETIALAFEDREVAFADLLDDIDRMMGLALREGVTPGETVGLAVRDTRLHLAAAVALLSLRCPHVGLPTHETDASNRATAARLGVRVALCDGPRGWTDGLVEIVVDDAALAAAPRGLSQAQAAAPETPAIYVKTSGSTDVPKLFAMSYARLDGATVKCLARANERRVMRTSTVEFDSSRIYRIYAFLAGRTGVLQPRDMADLGAASARLGVTEVHIGTYALASLVRSGRPISRMGEATGLLTGGSRVPGALRAEIAGRLTRNLWISYATSEIGQISLATPDEHEAFPEGVGRPREDVEVEIVDADGALLPHGEVGEIRVRRALGPAAYVGREAPRQFRDGWFYPGDLVSWPQDGPLIHHGRADDVMLLNGVKISGAAIEDALQSLDGVREAVAFPIRSRLHGEIPAAAVVLAEGAEGIDAGALLSRARAALGVRAPRRVVILDAIPRTHTGKPLRRALSEI